MAGDVLVTAPDDNFIDIELFREYSKIEGAEEEDFINLILQYVEEKAESITRRKILLQEWQQALDYFPRTIVIPFSPVVSVESIQYYDTANVLQTLSAALYEVDTQPQRAEIRPVEGECWPQIYNRFNAVLVNYTVGYAAGQEPAQFKIACLGLASKMYDVRSLDVDLTGFKAALGALIIRGSVSED